MSVQDKKEHNEVDNDITSIEVFLLSKRLKEKTNKKIDKNLAIMLLELCGKLK